MRNREQREAKALQLLRRWPDASALDIGVAAVHGEARAIAIPRKAKAAIGLSIAVELVRRKLASPTKDNRFAATMRQPCKQGLGMARWRGLRHSGAVEAAQRGEP
ncbi:MAG: hypothetical protein WBG18_23240 [Xanthobacteraceae bacterium]